VRDAERYPFLAVDPALGAAGLRSSLPLSLTYESHTVQATGLLDTGAMVNVLPYGVGLELGADWERQTTPLRLTGNLARYEARALLVSAVVGQFDPVQLVFAWTQAQDIPMLFGQVNFFMAFDVCFYRSQLAFEIRPAASSLGA